jgi:GAF domain-containing protein
VSPIATPLIANEQAVGTLHIASCTAGGYGELELTGLELVGSQISGAIGSMLLLQSELKRVRQRRTLFSC